MIKLPIDKVDRIYHLSDIHIRNVKRHKEYRSVFKIILGASSLATSKLKQFKEV